MQLPGFVPREFDLFILFNNALHATAKLFADTIETIGKPVCQQPHANEHQQGDDGACNQQAPAQTGQRRLIDDTSDPQGFIIFSTKHWNPEHAVILVITPQSDSSPLENLFKTGEILEGFPCRGFPGCVEVAAIVFCPQSTPIGASQPAGVNGDDNRRRCFTLVISDGTGDIEAQLSTLMVVIFSVDRADEHG